MIGETIMAVIGSLMVIGVFCFLLFMSGQVVYDAIRDRELTWLHVVFFFYPLTIGLFLVGVFLSAAGI